MSCLPSVSKEDRAAIIGAVVTPDEMGGLNFGLWLGYPVCCILDFADRVEAFRRGENVRVVRKLDGTGFVPCPECNASKSEDELREEIAAGRLCPEPFPDFDDYS